MRNSRRSANRALPMLAGRSACVAAVAGTLLLLAACSPAPQAGPNPDIWPSPRWPLPQDAGLEQRVHKLLAAMTLEEKVGQVIQADIASVTPDDVRQYHLGSILAGGGSAPGNDEFAPPQKWLALADAFYKASVDRSGGGVGIPIIWGIDAMHGHSNIVGATLFPHNIGLGAAHDPGLVGRIAAATAQQVRTTGIDWTFSPTVAVPQDDRWGRTYEGYSEDPAVVASYAGVFVRGLQGDPGKPDFLGPDHVISSVKHFIGDGGTENGQDQGDAKISEQVLRDIHGAGYPPAIAAGVQTVMASYSSWNGVKNHGNHYLLTDVLKGRMNFGGFVVGDWNGHGQIPGCRPDDCPAAINAGLDMYMAPDSWKGLYHNLLAEVMNGTVPMGRLDDAVSRILRVKIRAGVFEEGLPSQRPLAGDFQRLWSDSTRALARDAVRQSLVLLKNENGLLPLDPHSHVLVTGDGADDIGKQNGGWTITWQGTGLDNSRFPHGTSIWSGIRSAVKAAGGTAELSANGSYRRKPDVAIVVFGEDPYAEMLGDRKVLALPVSQNAHLAILARLRAQGIPVVSVLICRTSAVDEPRAQRIARLRGGMAARHGRRRCCRPAVSRGRWQRALRLHRHPVVFVAAQRRRCAAQCRSARLRPAVRTGLRAVLRARRQRAATAGGLRRCCRAAECRLLPRGRQGPGTLAAGACRRQRTAHRSRHRRRAADRAALCVRWPGTGARGTAGHPASGCDA